MEYPKTHIEANSFSGFTFERRYPKVIQDIIESELFTEPIGEKLILLRDNLPSVKIQKLYSYNSYWDDFYHKHLAKKLFDLPFFEAEVYFFELILDTVDYSNLQIDPFSAEKIQSLKDNLDLFKSTINQSLHWNTKDFIRNSLYGNQSDLSQLKNESHADLKILINDTDHLIKDLKEAKNVEMILDNSGPELFSDLLFTLHMIEHYNVDVKWHIKSAPIFVSDVIQQDIDTLLDTISFNMIEKKVRSYLGNGKIKIQSHEFWNSPKHFSELHDGIFVEDALILSKGDANYRRFFEDRKTPCNLSPQKITSYLKQPVYCLRTLKSEIQTGLSKAQLTELNDHDMHWMTNGKNAVIQKISSLNSIV